MDSVLKQYGNGLDVIGDLAKDVLAGSESLLKDADSRQTSLVNVGVNRAWRDQVVDADELALLAVSVDSPNSLFNPHGIPRQVIVDHAVAELIIEALAADF